MFRRRCFIVAAIETDDIGQVDIFAGSEIKTTIASSEIAQINIVGAGSLQVLLATATGIITPTVFYMT